MEKQPKPEMNCLVCNKTLEEIDKSPSKGIKVNFDIENLSEHYDKFKKYSYITGYICDKCFEEKHKTCFGTILELKRTYTDIYFNEI